jgi:acyl phosphate:glycerol-3-phosphate acyltransferase
MEVNMTWVLVVKLVCVGVFAYLLCGVNGAIITSKYFYKRDIRDYGSGNAGLTNFYRVFGKYGAVMVIAIDIGKTVIPVLLASWLLGLDGYSMLGKTFTGFFAMLGHAYPVIYEFKGGKTVMVGGALVWLIDWRVALLSWGVFAIIFLLTRYVSLGSIIGGIMLPIGMLLFNISSGLPFYITVLCAMLLIFCHRKNIRRLLAGEESKFTFRK